MVGGVILKAEQAGYGAGARANVREGETGKRSSVSSAKKHELRYLSSFTYQFFRLFSPVPFFVLKSH